MGDDRAPPPASAAWAYFLDFDGTLVDIAEHPGGVRVAPQVIAILKKLEQATGGALAVISGRAIAQLDRFLAPLRLSVAGQHGHERRDGAGRTHIIAGESPEHHEAVAALTAFAAKHPGLIVEDKGVAVALHFRGRTELEGEARALMQGLQTRFHPNYRLLEGKKVLELKPTGADKGAAIATFMAEPPFCQRTPVFAGDDITDEDGFAVVNAAGGLTIRIGHAQGWQSKARYELDSPEALLHWLNIE